tara:strand:- start:419 stop:1552 length:1134 start_codon:yes stop_codon:yes gene_type:complete
MSSFKDRPLKKCHSDKRLTIDVIHNNMINLFNEETDEIKILKEKLKKEKDKKTIDFIENKIKKLNNVNKNKKHNYFLDNGLLLNTYYNNNGEIKKQSEIKSENNILSYFKKNEKQDIENDKIENQDIENNKIENTDNIIDAYLSNIDNSCINNNFKDIDEVLHKCKLCDQKLDFKTNNSELFCSNCGYTQTILLCNDKISYKDVPREISYFAYKRINHFNEWLAQFQAKETTEIPKYIYTDVINEFNKNINSDINKITYKQVREILKKLKYNKYYEHIPHIITVIGGNKAPTLLNQYEELLRNMFKEIQIPFMNNCPNERKNFLSYSYVLHKFCQLLELDDLLIHFPLLKSREKLQQQDKIWENICKDLKWQYIPSV